MRHDNPRRPGLRAQLQRRPAADTARFGEPAGWHADGEMMRAAYTLHPEDDDWGQAGTLVREVLDDAARDRLVANIVGHLLDGVTEPVLERAFEYWRRSTRSSATGSRRACAPSRGEDGHGVDPTKPARRAAKAKV